MPAFPRDSNSVWSGAGSRILYILKYTPDNSVGGYTLKNNVGICSTFLLVIATCCSLQAIV